MVFLQFLHHEGEPYSTRGDDANEEPALPHASGVRRVVPWLRHEDRRSQLIVRRENPAQHCGVWHASAGRGTNVAAYFAALLVVMGSGFPLEDCGNDKLVEYVAEFMNRSIRHLGGVAVPASIRALLVRARSRIRESARRLRP